MFEVEPTAIDAVKRLRFAAKIDHRGYFAQVCSDRSLAACGIGSRFVADNQVLGLKANVLRGLHFQPPPFAQAKLVRVTRGSIFDVAVDLRVQSPTFGEHVGVRLGADAFEWLYVPEGFAHGFCTLEDDVEVQYKVTRLPEPGHELGVAWNDEELAIDWPLTGEPVLADRDKAFPCLAALKSSLRF